MALNAWQQKILDASRANGGQGTIQEMLQHAGAEFTPANFAKAKGILDAEGIVAPMTIAENQARLAREAGAGKKPLTPYQQQVYDAAKASEGTSQGVASYFNSFGYPVKKSDVDDILMGAGLTLTGPRPGAAGGAGPSDPAVTPQAPELPGGLPGRQPDGTGMYGGTTINYINTPGAETPQHPQLRGIFSHMRRRAQSNYRGQTDTILTSARGVQGNPMLRRRALKGTA